MFQRPSTGASLLHAKGVSLERLLAFVAAYDAGGIARAAPDDPVRQSQMSRQISELEAALNVELFVRAGRTRAPTAAASVLARTVHDLVNGIDDVVDSASLARIECTVGAGDSVLQWLVLPLLGKLRERVHVSVHALSSKLVASSLADGSIDIGILDGDDARDDFHVARIGRFALGVASLRKTPLPLAATTDPAWADRVAALGRVSLRCDTYPQVARAVAAGSYRGVLPNVAMLDVRATSFKPIAGAHTTLVVAWRKRLDVVRPGLREFRRALVDACAAAMRGL